MKVYQLSVERTPEEEEEEEEVVTIPRVDDMYQFQGRNISIKWPKVIHQS